MTGQLQRMTLKHLEEQGYELIKTFKNSKIKILGMRITNGVTRAVSMAGSTQKY